MPDSLNMMYMKQFTNTYNNNYESKSSLKVMSLWLTSTIQTPILYGPFAPALLTVSSYVGFAKLRICQIKLQA